MKQFIKDERTYSWFDDNDKLRQIHVNYSLEYINGELISIRNEYGFKVETNSEVWEHYSKKLF